MNNLTTIEGKWSSNFDGRTLILLRSWRNSFFVSRSFQVQYSTPIQITPSDSSNPFIRLGSIHLTIVDQFEHFIVSFDSLVEGIGKTYWHTLIHS